jgi:phospho-N-acetylmuramoyl-pentapeptide-transferase
MLYWAGDYLKDFFGPFRLFTSHLLLASFGMLACWLLSWWLLPVVAGKKLPKDRGRPFAVEGEVAKGKPTGAGVVFVTIFIFISILVVPFSTKFLIIFLCVGLAMLFGFLDDKSHTAWGEYSKGLLDLLLAAIAAFTLYHFDHIKIWLPFTTRQFTVPPFLFIAGATIIIWIAINATNCTDGVDGLSGTLIMLALITLGVFLYGVVGHIRISRYLLLPHYIEGARWGVITFTMVGSLAAYLWFNASPSSMLMGDAGSRAIGLLLGVLVVVTGNPVIIFVVAGVLLVNGGTGLIKVVLLRFFKIGILQRIRFPLHDHFRHNRGWSDAQVLIRFAIFQVMMTIILMGILIKVR